MMPRYRTSTPVKLDGSTSRRTADSSSSSMTAGGQGGSRIGGTRHSLPSLPQMSSIAHQAPHHAGGRDSLGSILEMGSSPVPPPRSGEVDEGHGALDDEDMLSNDGLDGRTAEHGPAAERAWRDDEEQDLYLLALSYARTHELLRAARILQDCVGPRARWLRGYTKYLAGEKRKQEQAGELLGPRDVSVGATSANPFAQEILEDIAVWDAEGCVAQDGFLLYLWVTRHSDTAYGWTDHVLIRYMQESFAAPSHPSPHTSTTVTYRRSCWPLIFRWRNSPACHGCAGPERQTRAVQLVSLAQDCRMYQRSRGGRLSWDYSVVHQLTSSFRAQLEALLPHLPSDKIPYLFFFVHATLEIHAAGESLHDVLNDLEEVFPGALCLKGWRGLVHYHVRGGFSICKVPLRCGSVLTRGPQNSMKRQNSSLSCARQTLIAWTTLMSSQISYMCRRSGPNWQCSPRSTSRWIEIDQKSAAS